VNFQFQMARGGKLLKTLVGSNYACYLCAAFHESCVESSPFVMEDLLQKCAPPATQSKPTVPSGYRKLPLDHLRKIQITEVPKNGHFAP
jgi:hypothetical protein